MASTPLPRLAPSTRPSATSRAACPGAASVAVSSTMARLEYDSTASTAPTTMSSSTSLGSARPAARAPRATRSAAWWRPTMSCSASVIRPRPISTRPTRPVLVFCREMNITTPAKISSGDSHDRSNEKTTAISAVPTSAPSITASAAAVPTRPLPTKLATIRQVAVLTAPGWSRPGPASGREAVAEAAGQHLAQVLRRTRAACRCARCACPTPAGRWRRAG
jgi:hypothetical protein